MPKRRPVPTVKIVHSSYQPSKAELEEPLVLEGASPEELARALTRTVKVELIEKPNRT